METRGHTLSCSQRSATDLSAGVGHQALIPDPLGVDQFATEAGVVPRDGRDGGLTPWAPPGPLHRHTLGPLPDAGDVEHLEAVAAVPGGLLLLDLVQTDHALRGALQQSLSQTVPQVGILVSGPTLTRSLAWLFGYLRFALT